jgi:Di-N-acetylchitobiase
MMHFFLLVVIVTSKTNADCPCADISLCQTITDHVQYEKVAFMISNSNWRSYDYTQLTTIVICTHELDRQLVCLAHSRRVRLVWLVNYDVKQLSNTTARIEWINMQIDRVRTTYTDGVNLDLEDEIARDSDTARQYTTLVQQLTDRLHRQLPGSTVNIAHRRTYVRYSNMARSVSMLLGVHRVSTDVAMIIKA